MWVVFRTQPVPHLINSEIKLKTEFNSNYHAKIVSSTLVRRSITKHGLAKPIIKGRGETSAILTDVMGVVDCP